MQSATTPAERDEAMGAIQRRHARALIEEARMEGRLTEEEARTFVERLEMGEDPRFLKGIRRGRGDAR